MNSSCKLLFFRMIKEADQFGAIFRPAIKQGQQEFKTVQGGLISIIIYGLSFAYFIYGIQQWTTNQILPTITEYNQVIDVVQYQQQQKILLIKPVLEPGILDPFDKKNLILMLMIQQYRVGIPSSNVTRILQIDGQFIVQNLELYLNNIDWTDQEYLIYLSSCQKQYLVDNEQCAQSDTIQEFWNISNMMEIQLFSQKFNPQKREFQQLTRQYFILYEEASTYFNNLQMQTTTTNIDQGILFPSIQTKEFVSDILQYSQTVSIQQFIKQFGVQIYLAINLRMDTQQKQQNIAYPNLSQVLANIGSIISTLMLFSYFAILLNNKLLEENAKMQIIKIYYPDIKQITITKTWYGRIVSIRNQKTNESYDIQQFKIYFRRLFDIAEQKLSIKNQIYELSRIQFAIQQLLTKSDIIKLRDKHLKLLIKPLKQTKQVQESENDQIQQLSQIQIVPLNDSRDFKISENKDLKDETQPIFFDQSKSIQDHHDKHQLIQDNFQEQKVIHQDRTDFELLCQNTNVKEND